MMVDRAVALHCHYYYYVIVGSTFRKLFVGRPNHELCLGGGAFDFAFRKALLTSFLLVGLWFGALVHAD